MGDFTVRFAYAFKVCLCQHMHCSLCIVLYTCRIYHFILLSLSDTSRFVYRQISVAVHNNSVCLLTCITRCRPCNCHRCICLMEACMTLHLSCKISCCISSVAWVFWLRLHRHWTGGTAIDVHVLCSWPTTCTACIDWEGLAKLRRTLRIWLSVCCWRYTYWISVMRQGSMI